MLASQALYQLNHLPNPLYFFKKILCIVDFFLLSSRNGAEGLLHAKLVIHF